MRKMALKNIELRNSPRPQTKKQLQATFDFLYPDTATLSPPKKSFRTAKVNQTAAQICENPVSLTSGRKKHIMCFAELESGKFVSPKIPKYRGPGPRPDNKIFENDTNVDKYEGSEKRKRVEGYMNSRKVNGNAFENEFMKKSEYRWTQKEIGSNAKLVEVIGNKCFEKHYTPRKFDKVKVEGRFHYIG